MERMVAEKTDLDQEHLKARKNDQANKASQSRRHAKAQDQTKKEQKDKPLRAGDQTPPKD